MQTVTDPLTGETFIPKRSDQRFATKANQIKYNNEKAKKKRKQMAGVNKILDKNRAILERILNNQTTITKSQDFLLGAGFNFRCNTHAMTRNEQMWRCIYEYAYRPIGNHQFEITRV